MLELKKFGANWCRPCSTLTPILEQVARENPTVRVTYIDIDDNPKLAQEYGVRNIPLVILEKNGKEVDRFVGMTTVAAINKMISDWQ